VSLSKIKAVHWTSHGHILGMPAVNIFFKLEYKYSKTVLWNFYSIHYFSGAELNNFEVDTPATRPT
jgi:hypothetical protein